MRCIVRWACRALVALLVVSMPVAVLAERRPRSAVPSEEPQVGDKDTALRRVPCEQVISRVDRAVGLERGKGSADLSTVAKKLNTSVVWVEHCMVVYGRRPRRPAVESAESRELQMERWEADEPDEAAPEDKGEPGERERPLEKQRKPATGRTPRSSTSGY